MSLELPVILVALVCLGLNGRSSVLGFNIDTVAPIVKTGPIDSYFGFSVAQHISGHDILVLVGAPRDLRPSRRDAEKVVRSGGLYKCPFTSIRDDCSPVDIDLSEYPMDSEREDQWLGATVASQKVAGGVAVTCAPRYKRVQASTYGPGLCISMHNNLEEMDLLEPCEGRAMNLGHEELGFCQVGFGLDVSQDGDMIVGAPGSHSWRGMIFNKLLTDSIEVDNYWVKSPLIDSHGEPITKFYSYLGMSMKIGRINGDRTYAVGAPRSNGSGQVLLFEKMRGVLTLEENKYLTGDQFGGGFGYELVVMDFDSDGMEDLVVAAPFEHGPGIGGAIYTFRNNHTGITKDTKPVKIVSRKMSDGECHELDCRNARFGLSLANLGDVDGDGYNDLAVGAPYEGQGAVYIFQGSRKGIQSTFSQRITPAQFSSFLPTFGFSITGGVDMDSNGNPDMVVGSYNATAVVLFRSRPVINVKSSMSSNPDFIDPKSQDCKGSPCFYLKTCFTLSSNPKNKLKGPRLIEFEIEKESEKKNNRIFFKQNNTSPTMKSSLEINKENKQQCFEQEVLLDPHNRDFLKPVVFKMKYWLGNNPPDLLKDGELLDVNEFPILDVLDATLTHTVHFKKNCSRMSQCVSSLKVKGKFANMEDSPRGHYVIPLGSVKDLHLEVEVHNNEEEAHETMLFVTLPEKVKFKGTDERGKMYVCKYEGNVVSCFIGNPMKGNDMVVFGLRLDPSQLDPNMDQPNITLFVNTTSKEADTQDDVAVLFMKVVIFADMEVRGSSSPREVYFGGVARGESSVKTEEDIGLSVVHSYEVKNLVRSNVKRTSLYISWPSELNDTDLEYGKHVLYLVSVETEGPVTCDLDSPHNVDPLKIKSRMAEMIPRSKREARAQSKQFFRDGKTGRIAILDCESGILKCTTFNCYIEDLNPDQSAVVRFKSRLWNNTFLQDFLNVDKVRIHSKAWIVVDPTVLQRSILNDISRTATIVLPDQDLNKPYEVDFWIIILSVCAGVLLLLLLIFILWKCGFFRRNKPEDMLVHQAKLVNQPLNT